MAEADIEWRECPVCAAAEATEYVRFPELAFTRCNRCGAVYKSFERGALRPQDFYEKGYFTGRKSGREKRFAHRVRKAMGQIRHALEFVEARSVLDVGCSMGYVIEAGRRLGLKSAGSDISEYAVAACREKGLDARVGTLERLPFADGEFDLVILRHVLEHTATPKAALDEVSRVLSPNGAILVAVPDLRYWKGDLLRKTYRYFRPDDLGQQHYVYYDEPSLAALLSVRGFSVVSTSKSVYRKKTGGPLEPFRFGAVALAGAVGRATRMRRELFFVAKRA